MATAFEYPLSVDKNCSLENFSNSGSAKNNQRQIMRLKEKIVDRRMLHTKRIMCGVIDSRVFEVADHV